MNNNLIIWDLAMEFIIYNLDLTKITSIPSGEIEYIFPNLSNL
jgi:hypothetical protein